MRDRFWNKLLAKKLHDCYERQALNAAYRILNMGIITNLLGLSSSSGLTREQINADKHFSNDYFKCREKFQTAAQDAKATIESIPISSKGPNGEKLTLDFAWIGSKTPKKLLFHTSGIHGVEGFAGSAIQHDLLNKIANGSYTCPEGTAIVFVHSLNPYGHAWNRRYNESNVDLARNYADERPAASETYRKIDHVLNPKNESSWLDFNSFKLIFAVSSHILSNILQKSPTQSWLEIKEAIAEGQYTFEKSLFYGGSQFEEGSRIVLDYLERNLTSTVDVLMSLDIHTGLGPYAHDSLICANHVDSTEYSELKETLGSRVQPWDPNNGVAYNVNGSHMTYIADKVNAAKRFLVTQEFGTLPALKVLKALIEENRYTQYSPTIDANHPCKQKLRKAFYPEGLDWKVSVIERGDKVFNQAMKLIKSA